VVRDVDCAPATVLPVGRSLKTAAEALTALRLLGTHSEGVTAETLGAAIGKSAATARYLLNTLCQEGFAIKVGTGGVHRLAASPPWGEAWGDPMRTGQIELPERLCDAVTELYHRTRQRAYLARWDDEATVIVDARGHQGLARIPDLTERIPLAQAHALAATKALVATCEDRVALVQEQEELTPFTGTTITSTSALDLELARVRRRGVAIDREEFAEGFCCVAAPIHAPDGRVAASLALSTPAGRFAQESTEIARAVREIAEEASRDWAEQDAREALAAAGGVPPHHVAPVGSTSASPPASRRSDEEVTDLP
jgi:DNA-binding IclR family transcriptional regulator